MTDLVTLANVSFALVLAAGANARFARIWTKDKIGNKFRIWVAKRYGYQSMLADWSKCPWCLGWWTAIPATALAWFPVMGLRSWWLIPAAWFAVAHAAGYWQPADPPVINVTGK